MGVERFLKNKLLADAGELAVVNFLQEKGFRLIQKNFSVRCGEIDAILEHKEQLLFVEVKTRSQRGFLQEGLVGIKKQQRIIAAAKVFLQRNAISSSSRFIRFDVAIVKTQHGKIPVSSDIDYIEGAFTA